MSSHRRPSSCAAPAAWRPRGEDEKFRLRLKPWQTLLKFQRGWAQQKSPRASCGGMTCEGRGGCWGVGPLQKEIPLIVQRSEEAALEQYLPLLQIPQIAPQLPYRLLLTWALRHHFLLIDNFRCIRLVALKLAGAHVLPGHSKDLEILPRHARQQHIQPPCGQTCHRERVQRTYNVQGSVLSLCEPICRAIAHDRAHLFAMLTRTLMHGLAQCSGLSPACAGSFSLQAVLSSATKMTMRTWGLASVYSRHLSTRGNQPDYSALRSSDPGLIGAPFSFLSG